MSRDLNLSAFVMARLDEEWLHAPMVATRYEWKRDGETAWHDQANEPIPDREMVQVRPLSTTRDGAVLSRVEALRRVVALADGDLEEAREAGDASAIGADVMHDNVLCALASAWRTHPDWQEAWA